MELSPAALLAPPPSSPAARHSAPAAPSPRDSPRDALRRDAAFVRSLIGDGSPRSQCSPCSVASDATLVEGGCAACRPELGPPCWICNLRAAEPELFSHEAHEATPDMAAFFPPLAGRSGGDPVAFDPGADIPHPWTLAGPASDSREARRTQSLPMPSKLPARAAGKPKVRFNREVERVETWGREEYERGPVGASVEVQEHGRADIMRSFFDHGALGACSGDGALPDLKAYWKTWKS